MLLTLLVALTLGQEPPRPSFTEWLAGVRTEALSRGLRPEIVDAALAGVEEPLPVILERDRAQAETVFSLEHYIARRLTTKLIVSGRDALARHRELLDHIGATYGVPPPIIAAIWGIESNYGRFSGVQVQFMPFSYLKYAQDFDGDGRRDIWSTPADVFASIANYLKGRGWTPDQTWGREVKVTADVARRIRTDVAPRSGSCQATRNMTVALPIARWEELGVRLPNGKPLPDSDVPASLVAGSTRHFLVNPDYDAILEYNCSHSYAITVALLGDAIASTGKIPPQPQRRAKSKSARRRRVNG